ncbi:hypothetical protein APHAL10511_008482 [Amanita phalloides]|nr:hypothetical protein APHAL10511_008482 [Amanita phalloides]
MDEDLSMPGSFPAGRHDDIPFQSWAAICRDVLSVLQDTTTIAHFPNRTQSPIIAHARGGEANTLGGEKEAGSTATLCAEDVKPSTPQKCEGHDSEHTASSDTGDLQHEVQYDPLSDEIEAMAQDIHSITNIPDRRRPVIIVEQSPTLDLPSDESGTNEPFIEIQDQTQDGRPQDISPNRDCAEAGAEATEAIPLVKRVFVSNRSLAENKGSLGSPFEDSGASSAYDIRTPGHRSPALTRVMVEDRLLADYLHSRSQSRHQSERTSNESLAANLFAVARSSVGQQQLAQSPVPLPRNTIPSQVELEGPCDIRQENPPGPSQSDAISSSEADDESKQGLGANISGTRPRRTSHTYGRAICRSELPDLTDDRGYSALESVPTQTTSIEEVFLDEESTTASETSMALRPRVLVNREELAEKLQNIQEKTRDNRLPQPGSECPSQALPGVEVERESLLSVLTRGRRSSSSTQRPRMAVPTASDTRRARTHSTVVHFSTSQDDLQVDFRPRKTEDERVVDKISEEDKTSRASPRRKVGLKEKIKEFMSTEARKNRARAKGGREKSKDPNG